MKGNRRKEIKRKVKERKDTVVAIGKIFIKSLK